MPHDTLRETLACVGGPLNNRRLSVPSGTQWFKLAKFGAATPRDTKVVAIENVQGITDFSTTPRCEDADAGESLIYQRKTFVTGEAGLIEVFSCSQ